MEFHTKYRVLKTSWGIAIDFEGTLEQVPDKNVIIIPQTTLTPIEQEQVKTGLESVFAEIPNDKKYRVDMQKVEFNPCHFQIDGLYWGSRDWLSKALNIKISEPNISYDKISKKYFFQLTS